MLSDSRVNAGWPVSVISADLVDPVRVISWVCGVGVHQRLIHTEYFGMALYVCTL